LFRFAHGGKKPLLVNLDFGKYLFNRKTESPDGGRGYVVGVSSVDEEALNIPTTSKPIITLLYEINADGEIDEVK